MMLPTFNTEAPAARDVDDAAPLVSLKQPQVARGCGDSLDSEEHNPASSYQSWNGLFGARELQAFKMHLKSQFVQFRRARLRVVSKVGAQAA